MWNIKTNKNKNQLIEKVIKLVTRGGGGVGGEDIGKGGQKVLRYIRTRNKMYNMMTTANTAV